ncbi:TIGR03083 family protein [Tsukamurella ocularis]
MDEQQAWQVIAAQRVAIADLLDGLAPDQWAAPSLCEGWTVTDVAGHLAAVLRPAPAGAMVSAAVRARGHLHGMIDLLSREAAAEYGTSSAAMLRAEAGNTALPRLTNWRNTLFDTQIHAQDIARPLGLVLPLDTVAAAQGAERIWRVGYLFGARKRFAGMRFEAVDADWSAGDGPVARGPIADLLLVLSGRPAGLLGLDGAGAPLAAARLGVAG